MDFTEEVTQLAVIIVVLLVAYLGINMWTKRGGGITIPSMGGRASGGGEAGEGGTGAGGVDVAGLDVDGADDGLDGYPRSGSVADRHGDRFNLTGRDAEAAAKVLKRMLQQDEEFKSRQK